MTDICVAGYRESDGRLWRCEKPMGHEHEHSASISWEHTDLGCEPTAFGPYLEPDRPFTYAEVADRYLGRAPWD